jgi:hypothetical protein
VVGLYRRRKRAADGSPDHEYWFYDEAHRERRCGNSRDPHRAIMEYRRRMAERDGQCITLRVPSPTAYPELVEPVLVEDRLEKKRHWRYDLPVGAFAVVLRDIAIQPDGPARLAKLTGLDAFRSLHTAGLPRPSVPFETIRETYEAHKHFDDADEMTRSLATWDEFISKIGRTARIPSPTSATSCCESTPTPPNASPT